MIFTDRKSKLGDILPMPKVSRSPSVTVFSTTKKMIPTSLGNREICWYNGLSYQSGDKFNSEDNCNTCTCMTDSLVTCTQLHCTNKNGERLLSVYFLMAYFAVSTIIRLF